MAQEPTKPKAWKEKVKESKTEGALVTGPSERVAGKQRREGERGRRRPE